MADLIAKFVCADLLPLDIGGLSLTEVIGDHVTVIAPFKNQHKAVSDLVQKTHYTALPAVNRASGKDGGRAIWFSQGQWVVMGPVVDPKLAKIDKNMCLNHINYFWKKISEFEYFKVC